MNRRAFVSGAIMSVALAGVDLFAAIVICGFSQHNVYSWVFLVAVCIACLLLCHAFVCFVKAWQKTWDIIDMMAAAGSLPALCLTIVAVTAIAEFLRG